MNASTDDAPRVVVVLLDWNAARTEAVPIRTVVFVEEQGVPAALELDAIDAQCDHAIARTPAGTAIATGRLLPDGHIGRMAVLADWRGRGVGRAVLEALMARASERGMTEVVLSAQTHAAPFYAKRGFVERGAIFMDAAIPHIEMSRRLR